MEYVYAALILNEIGRRDQRSKPHRRVPTQRASTSRNPASRPLVAALEDVDISEAVEEAAAAPVAAGGAAAPAEGRR